LGHAQKLAKARDDGHFGSAYGKKASQNESDGKDGGSAKQD
jgi:hypothetical protein